jgi:hypothetical protein
MIEQYEAKNSWDVRSDLDDLKSGIVIGAKAPVLSDKDPTEKEWHEMFAKSKILKVSGNTICLDTNKGESWWGKESFISAVSTYVRTKPANKTLEGEMVWYDLLRNLRGNDPANKLSKEALDEKYASLDAKLKDLGNPDNLDYFAQVLAWTMPKNGEYWSLQVTTGDDGSPLLKVYETDRSQGTISERFIMKLWNPELIEKLLTKMFSYIDTTTNKTDGGWNYMKDLFQ